MSEIKHKPPELEAVELEAVGWFVRTKRTSEDSAGWLIADCSTSTHGEAYAKLFSASLKMREALYALMGHFDQASYDKAFEMAHTALAAAEGRTEEKEG